MPDLFDKLKQYGSLLGKGLMLEMAPGIAAGLINELFHQWNIDVAKITQDVQHNRSLWDAMAPDQRKELNNLAAKIGNLDFFTPSFIIDSIKNDFPGVASLLINWEPGMKWLTEQLEDIKSTIQE